MEDDGSSKRPCRPSSKVRRDCVLADAHVAGDETGKETFGGGLFLTRVRRRTPVILSGNFVGGLMMEIFVTREFTFVEGRYMLKLANIY